MQTLASEAFKPTVVVEETAAPQPVAIQPDFSVPVNWRETRRHMERVVLGGKGPKDSGIMFIMSSVLAEDTIEEDRGAHGIVLKRKPAILKGAHGMALKDLATSVGILVDREVYVTALCKWLLPKESLLNPKPKDCQPGVACLERELGEVQPKVVVTFGKAAFDFMCGIKMKFNDAIGAWFWSEKFQCRVLPMQHYYYVAAKPEWMEQMRIDMAQVKQAIEEMRGVVINKWPLNYQTIHTAADLHELVKHIKQFNVWSLDCEWHGRHHVEGQLRSMQIGWQPGHAAYIRFMDDNLKYVFDVDYAEAGKILAGAWEDKDANIQACGHHISADYPWTYSKLGLSWYNRTRIDTEFAYQCCNEHAALGLERMSLRFTDLGRYEMELEEWKRNNKEKCEGGYGYIPDSILIPYACRDVDVPLRSMPRIEHNLDQQGMLGYYRNIMNPFVTNIFTQFAIGGLPMNREALEEMRSLYSFAYDEMNSAFRQGMYDEAWDLLARTVLSNQDGIKELDEDVQESVLSIMAPPKASLLKSAYENAAAEQNNVESALRNVLTPKVADEVQPALEHAMSACSFNIRSADQLKRWLFDVKKYTPVKSTSNKAKGVPSMDWEKVLAMKPERREGITPAVDKQTLQILQASHKDKMLDKLLDLNAVGNIRKAFLKDPVKDENGNVVEEAGLFTWIAEDDRVHGMHSMTETGRPRAWNPNDLNWPSYVQDRIKDGIGDVLKKAADKNRLPEAFQAYLQGKKILPVRSCVQAPPGYVFTESDFRTAEVLGLAFISGDANLIRIMTQPDPNFGQVLVKGEVYQVRLRYSDDCGIAKDYQDPKYLMSVWEDGVKLLDVSQDMLLRHDNGCLKHPFPDLHWGLIEMVRKKPRECMKKKQDRGAGKVGNFCLAEGELVLTQRGPIPIENVRYCDLLWDGVEWVEHGGVICTGIEEVHTYQGLSATDNHEVWTVERGKVRFGEARTQRLELVRAAATRSFLEGGGPDYFSDHRTEEWERLFLRDDAVPSVRHRARQRAEESRKRFVEQMSVSRCCEVRREVSRYFAQNNPFTGREVSSYEAALRAGHPCVELSLQGAWNQSAVRIAERVRDMGFEDMAGRDVSRQGLRPAGERRALRAVEFETCGPNHKSAEPQLYTGNKRRAGSRSLAAAAYAYLYGTHSSRTAAIRYDRGTDSAPPRAEHARGRTTKVYDILNAGPRKRFTCSGVLVSNSSAYGATPSTLERKIESDTGVKPEPGTGQGLLDALGQRQPVAQAFLKDLERAPEEPGFLRAASGKVRHFVLPPEVVGFSGRLRKSIISAQGREARNYFMQESVAATAQRAANWLLDFGVRFGLEGRAVAVLYDSVVTMSPMHERFIWAKAHEVCMYLGNAWEYHGRILRYPIDTEFNPGWSLRPKHHEPTKKIAALYDQKDYMGTPDHMAPMEKWLDQWIDYLSVNERASLSFSGLN